MVSTISHEKKDVGSRRWYYAGKYSEVGNAVTVVY